MQREERGEQGGSCVAECGERSGGRKLGRKNYEGGKGEKCAEQRNAIKKEELRRTRLRQPAFAYSFGESRGYGVAGDKALRNAVCAFRGRRVIQSRPSPAPAVSQRDRHFM